MKKFKFIEKEKISRLPKNSGVYCFKKGDEILYLGKAANIRERVKNHFQQPSFKDYLFLDLVEKIGYIKTDSEIEALILEANLIKKYQPKYNVVWRDDKNYFFVGITKEDFPRIFWTHQKKLKKILEKKKINVEFIGPFVDGKALKQTLKTLRKIFPFRSCKKIPKRPCLWYHLGRCPAPCLLKAKFSKEISDSLKLKKIAQKNSQKIIKILKEGKALVLKELKKEMKTAAKKKEFEEAARIRDQISALEKILEHSRIFEEEKISEEFDFQEKLKKILKVKKISKIEAFDVSNIKGKMATGALVVFVEGKPEKNLYRKFKIKFEKKPNDIAMIKEVLERRLRHNEWEYPDLILIDGGKAHLNSALKIKAKFKGGEKIKICALAKTENKLFVEGEKKPIFLKDLENQISNFILRIDQEAHRFAISYHKKLREKSLLQIQN